MALLTTSESEQGRQSENTVIIGMPKNAAVRLFYGYDAIPEEWLAVIKRREWIEEMCEVCYGS